MRGTFANIRLQNQLVDVAGGYTRDFTQEGAPQSFIFDACENYKAADIPLVVLAGKEYGSGSSRDWAAKGTTLLGVKVVIAESYERIHRSNLIGMGVLPLQYPEGQNAESLGLTGTETFAVSGVTELNEGRTPGTLHVTATPAEAGSAVEFDAVLRILEKRLGEYEVAQWTEPKGGYFISLDVVDGTANRVWELARDAGILLTQAGSAFPYGQDDNDRNIRLAPTLPPQEEVEAAMDGVATCVLLAAVEKLGA